MIIIEIIIGLIFAITIFVIISPLFANILKNNPQHPEKLALYTEVSPGQYKAKMRQGKFIKIIDDDGPEFKPWSLWYLFDSYLWFFGLRAIGIPYFQSLYTYKLPRFKAHEEIQDGREVTVFESYTDRSDHVRTLPFTFPFIVSGAEIQTVPFTIKGSIQVRVMRDHDKAYAALFNTDSWGIFLNQALISVIRGTVQKTLTIDKVIGGVMKDIWSSEQDTDDSYKLVREIILEKLKEYEFDLDGKLQKMSEIVSLDVISIEITNFEPELSPEEAREIRAAIRGRQLGRGRDLEGQGEAGFQKKVLKVASKKGEHGHTSMLAEAMVRAATGKNGSLIDALAAAFLKNQMLPGGKS